VVDLWWGPEEPRRWLSDMRYTCTPIATGARPASSTHLHARRPRPAVPWDPKGSPLKVKTPIGKVQQSFEKR